MTDLQQTLYLIADEMRSVATLGKLYAANPYELERAHRVMELAARVAALADEQPLEIIKATFEADQWGRVSPVIGVDAAVFNHNGEILLIQRRDNAHWAMPGGVADVGETPPETALRELWEEAGLRGRVVKLLGVFDGRIWQSQSKVHLIHPVFQVACDDLTPRVGMEAIDARFFAHDQLPTPLHGGHDLRVPKCFELLHSSTFFDPADSSNMQFSMIQRPEDL